MVDASNRNATSLSEAVMGITDGLFAVAVALENIANAIKQNSEGSEGLTH